MGVAQLRTNSDLIIKNEYVANLCKGKRKLNKTRDKVRIILPTLENIYDVHLCLVCSSRGTPTWKQLLALFVGLNFKKSPIIATRLKESD